MKFVASLFFLLFFCTSSFCQKFEKAIITYSDQSTEKESIYIDYNKSLIYKVSLNRKPLFFSDVSMLEIGGQAYIKTSFDGKKYFAFQMLTGNSTLYNITGSRYLIDSNVSETKLIDFNIDPSKISGKLSFLYNDCNEIRDFLFQKSNFSENDLANVVSRYNSCNYEEYKPTDLQVKKANRSRNDKVSFYVGAGLGLNSIKFEKEGQKDELSSTYIQLGIQGFPGFSPNKENNFSISAELQYWISPQKDFQNTSVTRDVKINSLRLMVGSEYAFFKGSRLKPIIGFNLGISSDTYSGALGLNDIDINKGHFLYGVKTGLNYYLESSKIAIVLNYLPETKTNVRPRTSPSLIVYNSIYSLGLNYHF